MRIFLRFVAPDLDLWIGVMPASLGSYVFVGLIGSHFSTHFTNSVIEGSPLGRQTINLRFMQKNTS